MKQPEKLCCFGPQFQYEVPAMIQRLEGMAEIISVNLNQDVGEHLNTRAEAI